MRTTVKKLALRLQPITLRLEPLKKSSISGPYIPEQLHAINEYSRLDILFPQYYHYPSLFSTFSQSRGIALKYQEILLIKNPFF